MKKRNSKNIETVLAILQDEIKGDWKSALQKLHQDYSMTWVYQAVKTKKLFPTTGSAVREELKEVYPIKGRQYDIKNIAEGEDLVMVELIESYPDPKTKKVYRTPLVLVLEFKDEKIITGRHYCDPKVSYLHLSEREVEKIYKKSTSPSRKVL